MIVQHSGKRLILALCIASFFALMAYIAGGVPLVGAQKQQSAAAHANQQASGHVTILVLDMSGSMGGNDPHGYRCSAADAYIDLSGVSDYIGVVGLDNNNGMRTGADNLQTAQPWINPLSTATIQDKNTLKDQIASKSNNCRPDANTPTYDALNQAYTMLLTLKSRQPSLNGSVILLTDGVPCPDVDKQINAVRNVLLPEFENQGWPIDTIGLGEDGPITSTDGCSEPGTLPGTFHDFLKGVAGATGGQFYDDGKGPVQGVSPLNIGAFFVTIFAKYAGETPDLVISPTQLNGSSQQRNFTVVDGTTKLDAIAIKDSSSVGFTLENPYGQPISAGTAGVFTSQDSYHNIYSISDPLSGPWIATANGTGQYMLYELTHTDITVTVDSVRLESSSLAAPQALPLGQNLVVSAHVDASGQPLSDNTYVLTGDISFAGGGAQGECSNASSHPFHLSYNAGVYTGTVSIPSSSSAGTYNVLVCASTGTLQNVVASSLRTVRLEIFPYPYLFSTQTSQYTDTPVSAKAIVWPLPLQWFYSAPVLNQLSNWPLQGTPVQPYAVIRGQVQWNGQLYHGATIKATVQLIGSCTNEPADASASRGVLPAQITQDGQGNFTVQFIPVSSGLYQISFETSGTFQDSQGSFGPQVRQVCTDLNVPAFDQLKTALWISGFYLFVLAFLIWLAYFWGLTPRPFGQWVRDKGSSAESNRSFSRAHRNILRWAFRRNLLLSRQTGLPRGLEFRFRYGRRIDVRISGSGASEWQQADGTPILDRFLPAHELVYRPRGADPGEYEAQTHFTILSASQSNSARNAGPDAGYAGYSSFAPSGAKGPKTRQTGKRSVPSSYDDYTPPSRRFTKNRKKKDQAPWERYYD